MLVLWEINWAFLSLPIGLDASRVSKPARRFSKENEKSQRKRNEGPMQSPKHKIMRYSRFRFTQSVLDANFLSFPAVGTKRGLKMLHKKLCKHDKREREALKRTVRESFRDTSAFWHRTADNTIAQHNNYMLPGINCWLLIYHFRQRLLTLSFHFARERFFPFTLEVWTGVNSASNSIYRQICAWKLHLTSWEKFKRTRHPEALHPERFPNRFPIITADEIFGHSNNCKSIYILIFRLVFLATLVEHKKSSSMKNHKTSKTLWLAAFDGGL